MRIVRFCILISFIVLQDVRMSYGATLLTAQYNIIADADARELGLGPSIRRIAIGGLKDDPSPEPLILRAMHWPSMVGRARR